MKYKFHSLYQVRMVYSVLCVSDMSNSIETAIAIAFFGTFAIGIGIAKAILQLLLLLLILLREFFQLLLLLLVLLRQSQNYCS